MLISQLNSRALIKIKKNLCIFCRLHSTQFVIYMIHTFYGLCNANENLSEISFNTLYISYFMLDRNVHYTYIELH